MRGSYRSLGAADPQPDAAPSERDGRDWSRLHPRERTAAIRKAVAAGETFEHFAGRWGLLDKNARYSLRVIWGGSLETAEQYQALKTLADVPAAPPSPLGTLIWGLRETTCHWPLWSDQEHTPDPNAALYCGAHVDSTSAYCAGHRALARRATPVRREIRTRRRDP